MRRSSFLLAASLLAPAAALVGAAAAPAGAQGEASPAVDLVKVDGTIDGPMRDYLVGSIEEAERAGSVVILQLDTPGTLGVDPVDLAERVADATVPVVAWVGPIGARVAGGAVLLLPASALSVASPGSGIGPVDPLDLLDADAPPASELPARPWLELGVLPDHALPAQAALDSGLVDLAAPELTGLDDVLRALDGRTVSTTSGPIELATFDQEREVNELVRFHDLGPGRRVLHAVANPAAIYLLLVVALALIAFELTQSGIGVAGVSGLALLGLAGYGLIAAPPWWPGLVLLVGGVGAMIADVQLRRLGPLSLLGLAAFAAGSVLAYGGVGDAIDLSWWVIALAVVGSALYYLFGLTVAVKSRERIVSTRRGLVGLVGEARGPLAPDGPVFVKGALWRGRATDGPIPAGSRVRVRGVDGLVLRVAAEGDPELEPPTP